LEWNRDLKAFCSDPLADMLQLQNWLLTVYR